VNLRAALVSGMFALAAAAGCATSASQRTPLHAAGDVLDRSAVRTQSGELPVMPPLAPRPEVVPGRGGGPVEPDAYAAQVRARLRELEVRVRDDVARGALAPSALDDLSARRRAVLATLHAVTRDGRIEPQEQRQLGLLLVELENTCYQDVSMPYAWSSGPLRYWP
jgi:hypothetical protein